MEKPRNKKRRPPSVFDEENQTPIVTSEKPVEPEVEEQKQQPNLTEEMNTTNNNKQIGENTAFEEVVEATSTPPNSEQTLLNQPEHEMGAAYNPLTGEVKKRDYAQNFGVGEGVPEMDRVPEPNITNLPPPPAPPKGGDSAFITGDSPQGQGGQQATTSTQSTTQQPQQERLNPDMAALSDKEAKQAASLLVDAILGAYQQVWGLTSQWVEVSEDKLLGWVMQDKISLDISININARGEEATLRDVYNSFNAQSKSALTVDLTEDSFVKVRQAMIREFTKRGWGVSDMQYIIQHFVRDAGQRALAVYQLKSTINGFTKSVMMSYEQTKKLREEMLSQTQRVEPSEPTVKKSNQNNPPQQTPPPPRQDPPPNDGSEFVESFAMPPSQTQQTSSETREVPFYESHEKGTSEITSAIVTIEEKNN